MSITNNLINTSSTNLYISAGNSAITTIYFCNSSINDRIIQVYVVDSGGSATIQTKIYHDLVIPAGDTFILDTERLLLGAGDSVVASCDSSAVVSATISYMDI